MPIVDSQYTSSDEIQALYLDPTNVQLLDDYALATSGVQLGILPANLYASNPPPEPPDPLDPCFTGENLVLLFNGEQISFETLFRDRQQYIGKGAMAFTTDGQNILVPGEIRDVFKSTVYELLHATFEGEAEPMLMVKTHRFWLKSMRWQEMQSIRRNQLIWGYGEDRTLDKLIKGPSSKIVKYPDGVDVYNMNIGIYHDYLVTQPGGTFKAVSNIKKYP